MLFFYFLLRIDELLAQACSHGLVCAYLRGGFQESYSFLEKQNLDSCRIKECLKSLVTHF